LTNVVIRTYNEGTLGVNRIQNMQLREWQIDAIRHVERLIDDAPMIWAVMGAGKSVAIAEIVRRYQYDYDVVVTVPTKSLVKQLSTTIATHTGLMCGQWYADTKTQGTCTVVCHDSLRTFKREQMFQKPYLWIADEAHKSECDTVKAWVEEFAPARRIGFSATPWRNSERQSVSLFSVLAYQYTAADAYRDGHVVMPRVVHPSEAGSINAVCWDWVHEQDAPGVCNAVDVEDAETFAASLDMPTMCVHYKSEHDADDARTFLSLGGRRCVVYVDMLSEGFDCPSIRWMCMRRPVKSRVRFAQEVGRGLRADTGKTECLIFDPFDLFGQLSMTFEAALGEIEEADEPVPVLKLLELFPQEAVREASAWNPTVEEISAVRSYLRATRVELQMRGLADATGSPSWRYDPSSKKQAGLIDGLMDRVQPDLLSEGHRISIEACWYAMHDKALKKGDVSDLITILKNWRKL